MPFSCPSLRLRAGFRPFPARLVHGQNTREAFLCTSETSAKEISPLAPPLRLGLSSDPMSKGPKRTSGHQAVLSYLCTREASKGRVPEKKLCKAKKTIHMKNSTKDLLEKQTYTVPSLRVIDSHPETSFLQSNLETIYSDEEEHGWD